MFHQHHPNNPHQGNHWIVVSMIGGSPDIVRIFDSLYTSIDEETPKRILELFGSYTKVEKVDCPKQQGDKDCGVFAIAIATSLASNNFSYSFDQAAMRCHLVKCYGKFELTLS